jgi:hypothetical protein
MGATTTTHDPILKTLFPAKMSLEILEAEPALGLCKHRTDFGGRQRDVPILYGNNQGHGSDWTKARAVDHNDQYDAFNVTRSSYYGFAFVNRDLIEASKNDKMAFVNALYAPIKNLMNTIGGELGRQFFGDHGGAIGVIAAGGISTVYITLTNRTDAFFFKRGMRLELSADDGTPASPAGVESGYVTVASVNRTTGVIACTANVTAGIATAAAGMYIFRYGNYASCLHGMSSWRPATDPTTGDSHFGVDRSVALDELCGILVDMSTSSAGMEQKLLDAMAEADWRGAEELDAGFMHPTIWRETVLELGSRVMRDDSTKSKRAGIGYESFTLTGPNGDVKFYPSRNVKATDVWITSMDHWTFDKLGEAPAPIKDPMDGKYIHRTGTADSYEIPVGCLGEFECDKPNEIVRVLL